VNGDSIQLQQVLLNLVVNAVEAMSEISDRPRTLSIYSENPDDDHIMVSVKDTGIGLTAEDMAKVFEAFFTTKQNGMGMGLAISQSIVEAHDGRLQVLPASPHGSIFQLILPVAHAGHRE
jgi:signal transduction histidine kinase